MVTMADFCLHKALHEDDGLGGEDVDHPDHHHLQLDSVFNLKYCFGDEDENEDSSNDSGQVHTDSKEAPSPGAMLAASRHPTPSSSSGGSGSGGWVSLAPQTRMPSLNSSLNSSVSLVGSMPATAAHHSLLQPAQFTTWHPAFSSAASADQQALPKEGKVQVSHSTIEKQRRDRINALIDELRELVPPAPSMKSADGSDSKRPKHVVLSDTITMLKHLQERVQHDEIERHRLQLLKQHLSGGLGALPEAVPMQAPVPAVGAAGMPEMMGAAAAPASAQQLLQHSLSSSLPGGAAAAAALGSSPSSSCPELPQAPANLPSAVGVLVEEGPGMFVVKVNCKDRHGLLSDITAALGNLPLQISRAAITTNDSGAVYDVFEIVVEPTGGSVTALDVQFCLHQALYKKWGAAQAVATPGDQDGSQAALKRQRPA